MINPRIVLARRCFESIKLAACCALSVALHAIAFFYPVASVPRGDEELIPIIVVQADHPDDESRAAGGAKATEISRRAARMGAKENAPAQFFSRGTNRVAKFEEPTAGNALPERESTQIAASQITAPEESSQPLQNPSAVNNAIGATMPFLSPQGSDSNVSVGSGLSSGESQGAGGAGYFGSGSGIGNGGGAAARHGRFTQARYRETPKPSYPESARRKGKEGRVLLRVLIDKEGKSKTVEISGTSGSQTLDRAAAEAVKFWRFSPARDGDNPVETWVRVPVDFRLTDVGDH